MPEGDTVHTLALALAPALQGQPLQAVRIRGQAAPHLCGRRVAAVTSRGKELHIELDDGQRLLSHLGLYGSWHGYRRGEPWQRPARQASLVLELADRVYVCFNARTVEVLRAQGFRALDRERRLGPDLTRESPGPERLRAAAQALLPGDTPVVDLLLDQRVSAGIGNVYKSEVLFVTRRSPWLQLNDLSLEDFRELYRIAGALLNENLRGGPRRTRWPDDGRGPLWVYRRRGLPCLVCGTPVQRGLLGRRPRSTYWCPRCQATPATAGPRG